MELLSKVVEVAPSGDRVIAAADNLAVARAAYDTAVALWPQAAIELRQKGRVRRGSSREAVRVFAQGFTRDAGPDALGYYSHADTEATMIPFPISYLLKNLDDFERRFNDDALIAQGMSEAVIILALGVEWFTRHVKPNNNPDPWMLNGSQQWFSSHPVSPPDQRPVIFRMRVTRLGDALFTVIRRVRDSELIKQRFLTRNDHHL
jgi:hypothetical protein